MPVISINYGGDIESLLKKYSPALSINLETKFDEDRFIEFLEEIKQNKKQAKYDLRYSYLNSAKEYLAKIKRISK